MKIFVVVLYFIGSMICAAANLPPAVTQPIPVENILNYKDYPPVVKNLIAEANNLIHQHLTYLYGSNNPANKGMDCSGTLNYLLSNAAVKDVPRSANEMYLWVEREGRLIKVRQQDFNASDFKQLKPGDLLFWTGTYQSKKAPYITHVMMYLGKNSNQDHLMFGASDGRTYQSKKMWGVSVFDLKLTSDRGGKFVGYSCIPKLTC